MQDKLQHLSYYRWLIFCVVASGTFMSTLTSSIVNVALPSITAALHTDITTIQWVVTAYLLAITSLLPLMGRLGDVWGRRKIYGLGFVVFSTGSLLCGISPNVELLIASRVLQAVGASALMSNSPAIVSCTFPQSERGKVLGMIGTAVALGTLSGPSLGGILVGTLGWHSIFFVNIPISIIGYAGVQLILPRDYDLGHEKIDYTGAALFTAGMVTFLLAFSNGAKWGWISAATLASASIAIISLTIFIHHERKVEHPMIDLSIFNNWTFLAGNVSAILAFMALFSNTILLPYFLHDILAFPPSKIGLVMSAFPLVMALAAPVSGIFSDKMGPVILTTAGLVIMAAGLFFTSYLSPDSAFWLIIATQALMGLGNGMFQSPNNSSVLSAVHPSQLGIAGGIGALARNMGMVLGTAMAVTIFEHRRLVFLSTSAMPSSFQQVSAHMSGYQGALLTAAFIAGLGAVISSIRK